MTLKAVNRFILVLASVAALASCVQKPAAAPAPRALTAPDRLLPKEGQKVETRDGVIYEFGADEVWHSHRSYMREVEERQRATTVSTAPRKTAAKTARPRPAPAPAPPRAPPAPALDVPELPSWDSAPTEAPRP